ncbi:hypothetical protein [Aetokthonos hydrillicola]|jgi:hypothetical protein|uniref:hypothetical protein n=1 Tax=Aetokthonos hydrillicola TaxID=1550245 RepID=UPI0036F1E4B8|nr:hypothetical protein [Aetokthonos hydrillicola CCALA 1050]
MVSILAHAQNLVYTLLSLMPSVYQRENLEAMLGLFLEAQGYPLPQHTKSKSPSALRRCVHQDVSQPNTKSIGSSQY